jgi:hypothetical protein
MARTRQLPDFTEELIRWRWSQRPTHQSLADEYHVSVAAIKDAINPKLRKRGRKPKKAEYEGPAGGCQNGGAAKKLTLGGGRRMASKVDG